MRSGSINVRVWISVGETDPQEVGSVSIPLRLTTVGNRIALVTDGLDELVEYMRENVSAVFKEADQ